jgi:predicted nucleic acid-binding protein
MIILDTNVISEAMAINPAEQVMRWIRFAPRDELYTTAITEAEMRYGAARKFLHKKGGELEQIVDRIFTVRFAGRVLPFDGEAARELPAILISMQRDLRTYSRMDAFIAAIARANSATIATRNMADFERAGVPLVNPWTA